MPLSVAAGALLLLALSSPLAALDPAKAITQVMLHAWQTEEGLPQSTVRAMVQTRDGYLWLGTQEGLVRFDGVRFTVFDKASTPELEDHYVLSLLEDRSGRLWAGTSSGGLVSVTKGRFHRYSSGDGLPGGEVRALLEDRQGTFWVGTTEGLAQFDGGRFRPAHGMEGLAELRVSALAEGRERSLWIGTAGGGVHRLVNGKRSTITTADGLSSDTIMSLMEDRHGSLWIGTFRGGLNRLREGAITVLSTREGLPNDIVRTLLEDRDGSIWIGTWGGGLTRYLDGGIEVLTTAHGLSHDRIISLLEDREGSLWIGTDGGGLNRLREGKFTAITTDEGLSNDIVTSVLEDRDGTLWIGTAGGGVNHVQQGKVTSITTREGLTNDIVTSLLQRGNGDLWVGTAGGGLSRISGGRLTSLTTREGLSNDSVRAILEDRDGVLWIGTNGGGLNRLEEGKLTAISTGEGLSSDRVRALLETRDGSLWVGTEGGGLSRIHEGRITTFTTREGLSNDNIRSLYEDRDGVLWIGTAGGGLNRLQNHKVIAVTTREGLFNDRVFQILEDESGNLWLSCNKGIFRVAKREIEELAAGKRDRVTSVVYGMVDGMKSAECNGGSQPAGWASRNGTLWFSTIRGVVAIDPQNIRNNIVAPPVVIEEMLVDGASVDRGSTLRLTADTQKIEIHYTGLSLAAPERNRFRYRLVGYDREWVDAESRRAAYYTNLPAGDYVFRVIASNNDGVWNSEGASLTFTIEPRFHETWWFRLLVVVAIASAFLTIYKGKTRYLKTKARELGRVVDERTAELREALDRAEKERARAEEANRAKSAFLANMSHELRTPLNGILGFAQIMDRKATREAEDRQHLATILRCGDILLNLINDVLSLSKMEAGRISLEQAPFDLENLLRGLDEILRVRAEAKDLALATEIAPGIPRVVVGDEARVRQILTNLLGNAIKFTARGGVILRARWADGRGMFEVEDTGTGIAPDELDGLFDPFVQAESGRHANEGTGLGLAISRNFARLMNGDVTVTSELERGSCFRVDVALPEVSDATGLENGDAPDSRTVIGLAEGQPAFRILVADDLEDNRQLLVKLLRSVGFDVREAQDGEGAVRVWRDWKPHLIWMDKRMPRMDGTDATRAIRAEERESGDGHVVIIALSASALEHERGELLAVGCDDFLPKPFREDAIFSKMAAHLGLKYVYKSG